jgi:hypothetical protein
MAVVAGNALINISRNALVFVIHLLLVMFVAENAFKNRIICRIYVTIRALIPFSLVFAGIDGEKLRIMIPGSLNPIRGIVTLLAISGKPCRSVIGIGGGIIGRFMTGEALRGCSTVTVGMAVQALQGGMRAAEGKLGLVVIERCRFPGHGGVAYLALVAEVILHVIGIVDRIKIAFVAGKAIRRQGGELPPFMAAFAGNDLMRAGQREGG